MKNQKNWGEASTLCHVCVTGRDNLWVNKTIILYQYVVESVIADSVITSPCSI